jgi:hypothetical protein
MSEIPSNWVERRAASEQSVKNAADVWKRAQATIAEACDSLRRHYSEIATVRRTNWNSNVVIVSITRAPGAALENHALSIVAIQFEADKPAITTKFANGRTREFPIEADSDHAFIAIERRELPFDEFSRLALEEAFFSPPGPEFYPDPHQKVLEMSRKKA